MPLYEYKCEKCGQTFEAMQRFSDPPLTVHEGCGGKVDRLISAPALQFKGSGWYITDYAKGSTSAPAKTDAPAAATTESKPAAPASPATPAPSSDKK